ncbi:hypothetical protein TD95_005134 [Thielaviopsis punctulata]|uniref:Alpha-L-rhamnosidase C-terminal domain-containing protein n=1 Tax=Thielaviopsis punctulata TaxID=72032 RepID=A0A0F4ZAQ6_9PEZI|nr:hypothetical protein TD95_005134 [Thielaviopsis punctulata]
MVFKSTAASLLLLSPATRAGSIVTPQVSPSGLILGSNGTITLNSDNSGVVYLDYGSDVEGHPTFEVVSATGDTSRLIVSYSETKHLIDAPMADGPLGLAAAMDSYRVNVYNISDQSNFTNRLVQGGFRYQKFNLSSGGELVLKNVGVKPTTNTTPLTQLPGSFSCSDEELTRIWSVGARTIQLSSIPADTIPVFWQVTPEGSVVESQIPQVLSTIASSSMMYYNFKFDVKPLVGGFGFTVLGDTLNNGIYIFCDIANGVIAAYNDQTELKGNPIASAKLPANVDLNSWHTVAVDVAMSDIKVTIDNSTEFSFVQNVKFYGSYGLGASFGHKAMYRNVSSVTSDGSYKYSASLTDSSFLNDFLLGSNPINSLVDGSRRDRIAYSGDLDIETASALVSTYGTEFIKETLELMGAFQLTPGFFVPNAKIQQPINTTPINANITGLIGYSFSILTGAADYFMSTGDVTFAKAWAPRATKMLDWANSQLTDNGLMNITDPSFAGDWDYYDPTQPGEVTKFNTIYAFSLQETIKLLMNIGIDTTEYEARLTALRTAINDHLWNDTLGAYQLSISNAESFAQDANALAILAGVTNDAHSATQVLQTLQQLNTAYGPLPFSNSSGFSKIISPFASAYHLRAALEVNDAKTALSLLKSLWGYMAQDTELFSGCFWEAVLPNGEPGLGDPTSMCHGWASGPTGDLTRYVLGVQATAPGFAEFTIKPKTLGLQWAKGNVPVPNGSIKVDWSFSSSGMLQMKVDAPAGMTGTVSLPEPLVKNVNGTFFRVNGKKVANTTFTVTGGSKFSLVQVAC